MILISNESFEVNEPLKLNMVFNETEYNHTNDYYEVFYIVSGNVKYTCNSSGLDLGANKLILVKPKIDVHAFKPIKESGYVRRDIKIKIDFFNEVCNFLSSDILVKITRSSFISADLSTEEIQELEGLSKKAENATDTESALIIYKTLTSSLICHLFAKSNQATADSSLPEWFSDLLKCFKDAEYLKNGLPAILSTTFYNHAHICKVFKKYTGMTMTEYLSEARLDYAAYLLLNTNQPVTNICYSLGFVSSSHFNKLFREKFNTTPLKYRKTNMQSKV